MSAADRDEWPIISSYSRAEALADGWLVDITEHARAAKFQYPTAVTATVWKSCVEVDDDDRTRSEPVRLWNLLWYLHRAIRFMHSSCDRATFTMTVVRRDGTPELVELLAMCGPGDDGAPVLTIMAPDEQ